MSNGIGVCRAAFVCVKERVFKSSDADAKIFPSENPRKHRGLFMSTLGRGR